METYYSIILATIPIIHFFTLFTISKINKRLNLLFGIYAIIYLDWLFVPFNYLILTSINFSWIIFFTTLLVSTIFIIIIHKEWYKKAKPKKINYVFGQNGLTTEGKIHFVFMTLQTSLVATAIISKPTSPSYVYMMLFLLTYILGYLLITKYIRKIQLKNKTEIPFILIGLTIIIIKLLRGI